MQCVGSCYAAQMTDHFYTSGVFNREGRYDPPPDKSESPSLDPFEQIAKNQGGAPAAANDDDPFEKIAKMGGIKPPEGTTVTGTFGHALERGVLPSIGAFPAIGAGA